MKYADVPRRIPSYEYMEAPIYNGARLMVYSIMGREGWRPIREYDEDTYGSSKKFNYIDGTSCTLIGKYTMVMFEREVHEFRSLT